jgi:hypothetical protein
MSSGTLLSIIHDCSVNTADRILEGKGSSTIALLEVVLPFQRRLNLLLKDIETSTLLHFQSLKKSILTMHIYHKQSVKYKFHLLRNFKNQKEEKRLGCFH